MDEEHRRLTRLLAATARAHHEATGGVNHDWADWYAKRLLGEIDDYVGFSPDAATIAGWLAAADARQKAADPDGRWPPFYARYILEEHART